jgi:leucyl aminopeptidase
VPNCFITQSEQAIPIVALTPLQWEAWFSQQTAATQQWLATLNFALKPGNTALLPDSKGHLNQVVLIRNDDTDFWSFGCLSTILPAGDYIYTQINDKQVLLRAAFAWGLGAYEYTRYKAATKPVVQLVLSSDRQAKILNDKLSAIYRVRDLINTPAEALGPAELAETVFQLGEKFHASVSQIIGDDLLAANYPAIYTVGKSSRREPRLIDLTWGDNKHPKITLVGKGICFDSGGLNLKPGPSMQFMKKDMGGAANALGLAEMIMLLKLPLRLRVLIASAENLISASAYKPGDIIKMRNGLSVEINNTDAEGRLVLADALTEADSENPELLIDFATLTGAARIAVGTEMSAFFTSNDTLANDLLMHSELEQDPIWRLPLYKPYQKSLESKFADLSNSGTSSYAGAITAALFLSAFVKETTTWIHFDFNAYNVNSRPGRPEGGEAMAIFALLSYLEKKYPVK